MINSYDNNARLVGIGSSGGLQAGLTSSDYRQPNTAYTAGKRVYVGKELSSRTPAQQENVGYLLVCTTGGTTLNGSLPDFTAGTAFSDGGVTWMPYDMKQRNPTVSGHKLTL